MKYLCMDIIKFFANVVLTAVRGFNIIFFRDLVFVKFSLLLLAFIFFSGGCNTENGSLTVRQIGELNSVLADGIAAQVRLIPFEGGSDTPIILEGETIFTLNEEEKQSLIETYDAGLPIVLLDAQEPAIDEFLEIIDQGISYRSGSHDILLAYIARNEGHYTARLVSEPQPGVHLIDHNDSILASAETMIVSDLGMPPDLIVPPPPSDGTTADLQEFPVATQVFKIPQPFNGQFNTTISVYAAHQCQTNSDHYVVNAIADWTPGSFFLVNNASNITWVMGDNNVCPNHSDGGDDNTGCSLSDYPTFYRVEMEPLSSEGMVTQLEAAPAGTQGTTSEYQSGISFKIGGKVNISGTPSITAGVTWSNIKTVIVPPLLTKAGNLDNEGAFWQFQYCEDPSCTGIILTANPSGTCQDQLGAPQQGQTPNGKFSDAAQTAHWMTPSDSRQGTSFEIKVTFMAPIEETQMRVWDASFTPSSGLAGTCNSCIFGCCDCQAESTTEYIATQDATFMIPLPKIDCDGDEM